MPRISTVLVLVTLIALVACGGGQRMTVQEYATACERLGDNFAFEDISMDASSLEYALAEAKKWNPPEELQRVHESRVEAVEATLNGLKDAGFLELLQELQEAGENDDQERLLEVMVEVGEMEDSMDALEARMEGLEEDVAQAERDLSPETRQILEDAGCL